MAKFGGLTDLDPRLSSDASAPVFDNRIRPQHRKLYDSNVSIEEYMYYAERTRADQNKASAMDADTKVPVLKVIFPPRSNRTELDKKLATLNTNIACERATISDEEWINASKAMRNATAMAIFYLLTTDVLGPFGLPYAVATTGWG
jgi:hypothetical protein